jgi:hypothetical protein
MRVDKIRSVAFKFQQRLIYLHRLLKQRHDHQKTKMLTKAQNQSVKLKTNPEYWHNVLKANHLKMLKTSKKLTISTNRLNKTQTLHSNEAKKSNDFATFQVCTTII